MNKYKESIDRLYLTTVRNEELTRVEARDNLKALLSRYKDCRNELCLKCGRYKEAHLGACKDCRWREE